MVQGVKIVDGFILNNDPATGELINPPIAVTMASELADVIAKANAAQVSRMAFDCFSSFPRVLLPRPFSRCQCRKVEWGDLPLAERIALLRKGIAAVEPIAQELAEMITKEMGKISAEAMLEVKNAIELKGLWLDMIQEANEDVRLGDGEAESVIVRDPLGVVALITPWNVRKASCLLTFMFSFCIC